MADDNNGYDIAEIERWLFNYFRGGMTEVSGWPWLGRPTWIHQTETICFGRWSGTLAGACVP
jgi:hypothetical protein